MRRTHISNLGAATFSLLVIIASCAGHDEVSAGPDMLQPETIVSQELSNQRITAFEEDSQGRVWIGTFRGLNRHDAHEIHQYYCTDSETSVNDSQINDIFRDSKDRLWIATINGVCLYNDRDSFDRIDLGDAEKNVYQILESADGRIFFNTNNSLIEYNPSNGNAVTRLKDINPPGFRFSKNTCHIDRSGSIWIVDGSSLCRYSTTDFRLLKRLSTESPITASYIDATRNRLWIACSGQMLLLDFYTEKFEELPTAVSRNPRLSQESITIIHPYRQNSLLLNSFDHGLFLLDTESGKILKHDENGFPFDAPEFGIFHIFTDSQQNLWLGAYDQGVAVKFNSPTRFNNDKYILSLTKGKSVMATETDKNGNLWVSTMVDGIFVYNPSTHKSLNFATPKEFIPANSSFGGISALTADGEGNVWMSSLFSNKIAKCRLTDGTVKILEVYDVAGPHMLKADAYGRVWVGTTKNKVVCIDIRSGKQSEAVLSPEQDSFISGLQPLDENRVLVIARKRPLCVIDIPSMSISTISLPDWDKCLKRSFFIPTDICIDGHGDVWIGTVGNGLLRYSSSEGKVSRVEGVSCSDIASIREDHQGNIWVSTQYGLNRFDRTSDKFVHFFEKDGTGGNQYYDRAACVLSDGTMVFGGTHGLTMFNPAESAVRRKIPLVFEDLKIHNLLVSAERSPKVMKQRLSLAPRVTLDHRQNGFSISFAGLDYCGQVSPRYLFKLEGYDNYWIDAGHNHECHYANLPAGNYNFKVRMTSDNSSIEEAEIMLPVTIKPSPWMSWWAISIYAVLLLAMAAASMAIRRNTLRNRQLAEKAIFEKEQEKRINSMNMSFFSNIAHEFRTPLTMISGPLGQLGMSTAVKGNDRELLSIIQHSVSRMLKLVNQLMDFNKLENDTLRLQVERGDVVAYLKSIMDIFRVNAANKGIEFVTSGLEGNFICLIDPDKLDKIVSNLLSNALKFTPSGGRIGMSFDVVPQSNAEKELEASSSRGKIRLNATSYTKIVVEDSGPGIPAELGEKVFERYFQLTDSEHGKYNWGTGIGLYYARALALLHHGALFIQTRPAETRGSAFTLLLPANDEAYSSGERVTPSPKIAREESLPQPAAVDAGDAATGEEKPTLLIVEDDIEVIHYLKTLLSPFYRIIAAYGGESALDIAEKQHPNLIISDVAMPGMDGYEFCRLVKNDAQLCHLPVILVTAQTGIDSQIRGLNTGADAYVTKPFDTKYLLALIRSLLSNREKLKNILNRTTEVGKIEEDMLSGPDKVFMDEFYTLMEKEISNSELDIIRITEMMRMSRTKFYYKVKELTGHSPATFFKNYKLNRAAELLREGRYNVSEIADMTGFSTHAHFTTSFKKQFGVTPSAYVNGESPDAS